MSKQEAQINKKLLKASEKGSALSASEARIADAVHVIKKARPTRHAGKADLNS